MQKNLKIILIGFGNVGRALAETLHRDLFEIGRKCGFNLKVIGIIDKKGAAISKNGINLSKALDAKKKRNSVSILKDIGKPGYSGIEAIEDLKGDIIIETTPNNAETGEPGISHIKKALIESKHVITTNKGPLALDFHNIDKLSKKNNVNLLYSGTVGSGLPILNLAKHLQTEKILSIRGVLNGTTNYILWRMAKDRISLKKALLDAQNLGIAEANSLNDIAGIDTACKLVIIANGILRINIKLKDVKIKGINEITLKEIIKADEEKYAFRLIGSINKEITVYPKKISKDDLICVNSAYNAITFSTLYSGNHTLIGKGAGGRETAGTIIRDLLEISKKIKQTL